MVLILYNDETFPASYAHIQGVLLANTWNPDMVLTPALLYFTWKQLELVHCFVS